MGGEGSQPLQVSPPPPSTSTSCRGIPSPHPTSMPASERGGATISTRKGNTRVNNCHVYTAHMQGLRSPWDKPGAILGSPGPSKVGFPRLVLQGWLQLRPGLHQVLLRWAIHRPFEQPNSAADGAPRQKVLSRKLNPQTSSGPLGGFCPSFKLRSPATAAPRSQRRTGGRPAPSVLSPVSGF